MAEDLEDLRLSLKVRLPARIHAAVEGYEAFAGAEAPADAKGFAAWHAACKAALAHVDLLIKLARWAEGGGETEAAPGDGLDRLLAEARAALDAIDSDEEDES
jgi:hypothetical protein